jgi:hypothetical protein
MPWLVGHCHGQRRRQASSRQARQLTQGGVSSAAEAHLLCAILGCNGQHGVAARQALLGVCHLLWKACTQPRTGQRSSGLLVRKVKASTLAAGQRSGSGSQREAVKC